MTDGGGRLEEIRRELGSLAAQLRDVDARDFARRATIYERRRALQEEAAGLRDGGKPLTAEDHPAG